MVSKVEWCNSNMDAWAPAQREIYPGRLELITSFLPEGEEVKYLVVCIKDNSSTNVYKVNADKIPKLNNAISLRINLNSEDVELVARVERNGPAYVLTVREDPASQSRLMRITHR